MQTDIAIVGGGLSGLNLAYRLEMAGRDCLVLEARDRVGGRILSASSANDSGSGERYDLGPAWIWPGQPRIARLAHEFGLPVFEQYSTGMLVYEEDDGRVRRDLDFSTMAGARRIAGGIAGLTDALANTIDPQTLRLSHRVTRVQRTGTGFDLSLTSPGGSAAIHAERVVFAAPPRLIADIVTIDLPISREAFDVLRATPTWMAGQAKLIAIYDQPFWRDMGLSGDGVSRRGPLMEIHDASPATNQRGALFGFVGLPSGSPHREKSTLIGHALQQLEAMFGTKAAHPLDVLVKDWAQDGLTATADDQAAAQHPLYGTSAVLSELFDSGLIFASAEMSTQFGGLLEGALEASEMALERTSAA